MSTSLVGRKLSKYEITALIGKGGMATVYKGYQPEIDRYVAIKVLPPHPGQDEQFIERFRLEARTIARLQHPHILPLYDYGTDDNILYLVMAYMDGGSLNDRIRKHGAMAPSEVERLLGQVGSALDYAHRQNIVHRDIKPDNILLDREGFALLADFGIVKIMEAGGGGLTVTGGLMGTPAYMSPEQGQGLPVDNRSDVYSLGVVVYEMLTGKPPYTADTPMQLVFKQINAAIPDIRAVRPDLPPALSEVMHRALAKDPDQRYESAGALLNDFKRALNENGSATLLDPQASGRIQPPRTGVNTSNTPTPLFNASGGTPPPTARTPGSTQFDSSTPNPYGTPPPGTMSNMQPTIITQPGWNPLILLVGLVIIGLLVVILVVILLNFSRDSGGVVSPPEATQVSVQPTAQSQAPTRVAAVPNTMPSYGRLSFGTTESAGDTLNLRAEGLRPPSSDHVYVAWLMPTTPGVPPLKLGELVVDSLGEGLLIYTTPDEANLAASYFAVTISLETDMMEPLPNGEIVYSGAVPPQVPAALGEILIASPDGFNGGSLLDGALTEARIGRQHSGLAAESTTPGAMHTHAEHTINILRGTEDDFTGDGRGTNPGRGVGVFFFLDEINNELNDAATAPGADAAVQSQVELIRVCVNNVRTWANDAIALELIFAASETVEAVQLQLAESTRLTGAMIEGIDLNENGQVEPFEGECGLNQIASYGIAISNMELRDGELPMISEAMEGALLPDADSAVGAESTPEATAESTSA